MADDIDDYIAVTDGEKSSEEIRKEKYTPFYKVFEQSKIAISKSHGPMWEGRYKQATKHFSAMAERWDDAINYYKNDQQIRDRRKKNLLSLRSDNDFYLTENVIFANVSALVPALLAKNPDVEFTATDKADEQMGELFERLISGLFARKMAPGVSIEPRMKRAIVLATLTNVAFIEVGYVKKEDASEQALEELAILSKELVKAKDEKQIKEIEGKLAAIDEKVSLLSPAGPFVNVRHPRDVRIDPQAREPDLSDANWVMVCDYIKTDVLKAVYGKRNSKGEYESIYNPTHIIGNKGNAGGANILGHDDELNNFTLLGEDEEHEKFGYGSKEEFDAACLTKVWRVWDKVTRRVYMFNDKNWSWPIWVWDDPYRLSSFFPIFPLQFYTDPVDVFARSEVMYYLDQQDEINRIHTEMARMRRWISEKLFFNKNVIKDVTDVEKFLSPSSKDLAFGIDLPEGAKITEVIGGVPAPSMAAVELFNPAPLYQTIDRISSVTSVLKSVEFKTNTTNKAIESYESSTQTRLEEKISAVENVIGDVGWALTELCAQFMTSEEVAIIVGEVKAARWENLQVPELTQKFNFRVVGGSTIKPTGRAKKEQAQMLGQVLGQFASASPAVVIVLLKILERAFSDDVLIGEEEWKFILESITAATQQGRTDVPQGGEAQAGPPNGAPPPEEGGGPPDAINQIMGRIEQMIDGLPPDAKQLLGDAIAQGVPVKQAVARIINEANPQGAR